LATTDEMRTIGEEIREDYEGFITELGVDLLDSRFSDDPRVLRMLAVNVYGLMHVGYEFLALFRWYVSGFFPLIGGRGSRYAAPVSASDFPGDEFPHVARSSEHQVVQSIRRSSDFRQPTELRQSADFPQDDKTPAVVELPQADETPITEEFTQADETPTAEYFPHTKAPDPSEEPRRKVRSPRFGGPVDTENAERAADAVKPSGTSGSERTPVSHPADFRQSTDEEFPQAHKTHPADEFPQDRASDPSEEPRRKGRFPRFGGPVDTETAERAADAVKPSGPSGSERIPVSPPADFRQSAVGELLQADKTSTAGELLQADKTPTADEFPQDRASDTSEEPRRKGRFPRFGDPVVTETDERAADAVKPSGPSGSERRRGHFESETGRDDASEGAVNLRGDGGADSRHDGPAAESVPESGAADAARFRQGEGSPLSDMSGHKDLKELARFLESQEEEERAHVSSRRGPLSHHASELDALLEELTERIEQEYLRFYGD